MTRGPSGASAWPRLPAEVLCVARWGCALLGTLSLTSVAGAEPLDFSAQQMTVEEQQLELSGDVHLRYDRFALRAERLRLRRVHAGLRLEGPARLRACPCEEPPVELEFTSAELGSDGALTLHGPRLVSGDLPLFYWPQLSFASPNSVGLLPPTVDYRGPDGLFLGAGVEVPLSPTSARQGALQGLDGQATGTQARIGVGGYTRFAQLADGARVDLDVSGPLGRGAVAWETLDGGMLDVDAHGAYGRGDDVPPSRGGDEPGAALAWRVDALRGARGLRAPGELIRVAMPEDRARFAMSYSGAPLQGYAQLRADAIRGGAGVEDAQSGAAVGVSRGQRLLPGLTLRLASDVLGVSADQPASAASSPATLGVWAQRAELEAAAPLGPLSLRSAVNALSAGVQEGGVAAVGRRAVVQGAASLSAGLPLSRRFGDTRHVLTPSLSGELVVGDAPTAQAEAALLQRLGRQQGYALELNVALGAARRLDSPAPDALPSERASKRGASGSPLRYIYAETIVASRWVAGRAWGIAREGRWAKQDAAEGSAASTAGQWAAISMLRLGRETGAQLQLTYAQQSVDQWDDAGTNALEPGQALGGDLAAGGAGVRHAGSLGGSLTGQLRPEAWHAPLGLAGSSGTSLLIVPLSPRFGVQVASAWDLTALSAGDASMGLLLAALAAGYRHPCGCLSARGEISHRLGRHPALAEAGAGSFSRLFDASVQLSLFE